MADDTREAAGQHGPPYAFRENEGYSQERPVENAEYDQDEDFDDLFEPSDVSDSELQASNPGDYTKAYNRQRKLNDASIPDSQKPKANPQLNTKAAIDDHIKSLARHTAKLKLNDEEAGLSTKTSLGAEKSDRATSEQVLDPRTRMILLQLLNRNILSEINGVISTGKEANVYHALSQPSGRNPSLSLVSSAKSSLGSREQAALHTPMQRPEQPTPGPPNYAHTDTNPKPSESDPQPLHRAIKVYKTSILVFKDRDKYVSGEFRFRQGYNKSSNRAMVKVWAEKEYRNLRRLHSAGIPCPEPLHLKAHVLVMGFLGDGRGWPAPRLRDVELEDADGEAG